MCGKDEFRAGLAKSSLDWASPGLGEVHRPPNSRRPRSDASVRSHPRVPSPSTPCLYPSFPLIPHDISSGCDSILPRVQDDEHVGWGWFLGNIRMLCIQSSG